MIFVDTGAWYAAVIQEDPAHDVCRNLLTHANGRLLTTDYIVDELLTLLTVRGHRDVAKQIGPRMWQAEITNLHWVTPRDVEAAWKVFTRFDDKSWSFTDCTSHAIMQQLGIVEALALDEHFRQFGFATIKP